MTIVFYSLDHRKIRDCRFYRIITREHIHKKQIGSGPDSARLIELAIAPPIVILTRDHVCTL